MRLLYNYFKCHFAVILAIQILVITNINAQSKLGLSVSQNGELLLKGKSYKGIGVNYFSAFIRTLDNLESKTDTSYRAGFRYLKQREIPFIRFSAGGYWPINWKLYLEEKDTYFKQLDAFVRSAEELNIGLIPSVFWHFATVPDIVGESVNQWGNPDSKTHGFMRQYVKELVTRYGNSPAIWGWEFGNEYNLESDLPGANHLPPVAPQMGTPTNRSINDRLATSALIVAYDAFVDEIRKVDKHRIITSGNANLRPSSWNLYHKDQWGSDTKEQYGLMLATQESKSMNVLSMHLYPDAAYQYFRPDSTSIFDLIGLTKHYATQLRKPLFIGEFGAQELKLGVEQARKCYEEILKSIETHQIPLSAVWVFDYSPHDTAEGINISPNNGPREYMLQQIQIVNQRFKEPSQKNKVKKSGRKKD